MTYATIYLVSFVVSIGMIIILLSYKDKKYRNQFVLMTALLSFWLLMEAAGYFIDNMDVVMLLQKLKYISITAIPNVFLIISYSLTWKERRLSKKTFVLFIVPLISMISIATNFPYTFIEHAKMFYEGDLLVFTYDTTLGFKIHTFYSYAVLMLSNVLLLYRVFKLPKLYRKQSLFIFLGSISAFVVNFIFVFGNQYFDTTALFILITVVIFYIGEYIIPKYSMIPNARNLVVKSMIDPILIVDVNKRIMDVNPKAEELIKKYSSVFQKSGNTSLMYMDLDELVKSLPIEKDSDFSFQQDTTLKMIGEKTYYYGVTIEELIDVQKNTMGYLYIMHDITKIKEHMMNLEKLNKELIISDTIINEALEAIVITDVTNRIIRVNNSMLEMTGYSEDELIGSNPSLLRSDVHDKIFFENMWYKINHEGYWEGEIWDRKKSGVIHPKWLSINTIKNAEGDITHYIGISTDITRMKKAEEELYNLAYFDTLTKLPNRTLFLDRFKTAIFRSERNNSKIALVMFDLDRFKLINDNYGHDVGDKVLIEVSKRITKRVRKSDTLSRVTSDEFSLLLESIHQVKDVIQIIEDILRELSKPFMIDNYEINVSSSVGVVISPDDGTDVDGLIRKADIAMYHSKKDGGAKYMFSSDELEKEYRESIQLELKLKKALADEEFELYLQPQYGMTDGDLKLLGAEALIRWPQKDGSFIPPNKFIEIAERNGVIQDIGLWVLEESFRLQEKLISEGIDINLSFNVSIKQLNTDAFCKKLKSLLEETAIEPKNFTIEITESLFFYNLEHGIAALNEIKDLGVKIALDDFGTGYSSMSYLNLLPIDYLKIDKVFIDELSSDNPKSLAYMILKMAEMLDLKTVAEGVEEEIQSNKLLNVGCDMLQGYYFGKPVPLNDFIKKTTNA